jgi:T5SS/PEP-CTERM-associated repeat protein
LADVNGYIENSGGKPATAVVAGTNSAWKNSGDLHVTDTGAQLFITNGGMVLDGNGYFGDAAVNSNCVALVSDAGSCWTNHFTLYIGNSGASNRLTIANSGSVFAQTLYIGSNANRNQIVVSNGGTLTVGSTLQIGSLLGQSNSLVVSGGTVVANAVSTYDYGALVLNSGLLQISNNLNAQSSNLVFHGGTLLSGGSYYGFTNSFLVGDGTDAATFRLVGNGSHTFSGGLLVASNAMLTGSGTLNGNVAVGNGGTLSAGLPASTYWSVTLTGNLSLSNGSLTVLGLQPSTGTNYSIKGLASVLYGGTLQLTNAGGTYAAGQSYQLFQANQYGGSFAGISPPTPATGLRWDTTQLTVNGTLRILANPAPPAVWLNANLSGANLTISGSGGNPYAPCYLVTTTNLAEPGWVSVATNNFDSTGAASFSYPVAPSEPQRFFQLQVD